MHPSYSWRSIWGARSFLDLGVRWKVGKGKSIRLWHDAWLGGDGTGKLITQVRMLESNTKVEALIDLVNHCWRHDIIKEVLFPIDVERVLQVPIDMSGCSDDRVWAGSKDGLFRVRDVYSLALKARREGSSSTGSDPIWRRLWNMHIHPKAKIFLWRALWDILPHGSNLRKKRGRRSGILCVLWDGRR